MTRSMHRINMLWMIPSMLLGILLDTVAVEAIPASDGTTGTVVNITTPGSVFEITGGTTAGRNLFHSFTRFSVPGSGRVIFVNDNGAIRNVLGRVTGNRASTIDGLITTSGLSPDFNLFLINPNGIIFGPSGRLDLGGSFVASTAQGIQFDSQGVFSTVPSAGTVPSLLTINPSALLFNQVGAAQAPRSVEVNGSNLSVPARQSLMLLGGSADSDGVLLNGAQLTARGGRVEIGAVGDAGRVALGSNFELRFPQSLPRADITLQGSLVDVSGPSGGTAHFQGGAIRLAGSEVYADNSLGLRRGSGAVFRAERLTLDRSIVQAITYGTAAGGNLRLEISRGAGHLRLLNGSVISAETEAAGAGGRLNVRANTIELLSGSGLGTQTQGAGDAGRMAIATQTLRLENGFISSNTFGGGNSGQIFINAASRIDLLGFSVITANADDFNPETEVFVPGVGAAGRVTLVTNRLNLRDRAQIAASTFGDAGAGGRIRLDADTVSLNGPGASINSEVNYGSPSRGGTIEIDARVLRLQGGAQISTSTQDSDLLGFTSGDAGDIIIRDAELVEIIGETRDTGLFAQVGNPESDPSGITGAGGTIRVNAGLLRLVGANALISSSTVDQGLGGNIDITGGRVQVQGGAQIQAATRGLAPGGRIEVDVDSLELLGTSAAAPFFPSALVSSTLGGAPAGGITVTANRLSVLGGARLSASSDGDGPGGSIRVSASEQVTLSGRGANSSSGLFVEGRGAGAAGNVRVTTPLLQLNQGQIIATTVSDDGGDIRLQRSQVLFLQNNALISATAGSGSGAGNGGNIDINTTFLVALPASDSDIVANAFLGEGGDIQISALGILQIEPRLAVSGNGTNDIDASSEFGSDGTVAIDQPDVDPSRGLNVAPPDFVDASRLVAQGCQSEGAIASGRLVITGRGGIALAPATVPSGGSTFIDLGSPAIASTPVASPMATELVSSPPAEIIEAQGWQIDEQGVVTLVAQAPIVGPDGGWEATPNCGS